jgi:hypothetical protein
VQRAANLLFPSGFTLAAIMFFSQSVYGAKPPQPEISYDLGDRPDAELPLIKTENLTHFFSDSLRLTKANYASPS